MIQVAYCGDLEMLEALLNHGGQPNCWLRGSTPIVSAVKSNIQAYEKVLTLLRAGGDPNFDGAGPSPAGDLVAAPLAVSSFAGARDGPLATALVQGAGAGRPYSALTVATRKRDLRMVRILLEAGADVNKACGGEGLPNVLFWATYWGELELMRLFVTLSKHQLDLNSRKYTNETIFDVVRTSLTYASMKK